MINSLNLLFFSFTMTLSIFAIGQNKNSIEVSVKFYDIAFESFFFTKKISVKNTIPTPFIMVSGFMEKENFQSQLFFRTKEKNKKLWSSWIPFPRITEGETPNRTIFLGGDVSSKMSHIQLKSNQPVSTNFKLRLFFPGHSKKINTATIKEKKVNCDCAQPDICGRSCWCPSGNCPIDITPEQTIASHFIVHHSAGQTTSSDFAAVVRSYYDFHTGTNGWDDIGYNWLIDGNGVIYEGRGQGLQGAHFSCMNENTIGICVIGNYENTNPTSEAINALQSFIAWSSCEENIDILGIELHPSSNLNLNNISGHKDGNDSSNSCNTSTVCPGNNLYNLLPTIRDEMAALPCINSNSSHVNKLLENEKIDIFPNPNGGNFQVNFENIKIVNTIIYNYIGQKINNDFTDTLANTSLQNKKIKISTNGLHHIQFHLNDGRVISQKVVVTK